MLVYLTLYMVWYFVIVSQHIFWTLYSLHGVILKTIAGFQIVGRQSDIGICTFGGCRSCSHSMDKTSERKILNSFSYLCKTDFYLLTPIQRFLDARSFILLSLLIYNFRLGYIWICGMRLIRVKLSGMIWYFIVWIF